MPVTSFFSVQGAILTIPKQIAGRSIKSVHAVVYFRESHGGYQSCFGFKNQKMDEKITLFCEVKWADSRTFERGDNDWLGSIEGGILGDQPDVKVVELIPETPYQMVIWGSIPREHEQIAQDVRTNFNDPIPDHDPTKFTFYEEIKLNKVKSLTFKHHQPHLSTILGFEDGYVWERLAGMYDYNDIIIEMCLQIDY